MLIPHPLTTRWLTALLADMGAKPADVAATLARADVAGFRNDVHDCPIARFVAARARALVPVPAGISVIVTVGSVTVCVTPAGSGDKEEIVALPPNPIASFLRKFDVGEYPALDAVPDSTQCRVPLPARESRTMTDPSARAAKIAEAAASAWQATTGLPEEGIPLGVVAALALLPTNGSAPPGLPRLLTGIGPDTIGALLLHIWTAFTAIWPELSIRLAPFAA